MGRVSILFQRRPIQSLIIAQHGKARILKLKVSAWLEIIEDLLDHGSVVFETCDDSSGMDVIK